MNGFTNSILLKSTQVLLSYEEQKKRHTCICDGKKKYIVIGMSCFYYYTVIQRSVNFIFQRLRFHTASCEMEKKKQILLCCPEV